MSDAHIVTRIAKEYYYYLCDQVLFLHFVILGSQKVRTESLTFLIGLSKNSTVLTFGHEDAVEFHCFEN